MQTRGLMLIDQKTENPADLQVHRGCADCSLRSQSFFCEMPESELLGFERLKTTKVYPKGTRVFMEGQTSSGIYMLCQGRVKVSSCSPDGKIMILGFAQPGDVLGLSAVISSLEYESTAEVVE